MSSAAVEFHPEAIAEARAAREWYAERSADVADAFMEEFDHAVDIILCAPRRWRFIRMAPGAISFDVSPTASSTEEFPGPCV